MTTVVDYYQALAVIAALFILLERIWPRVPTQPLLRTGWFTDAVYLIFNSKYAGILVGYLTVHWLSSLNAALPPPLLARAPAWLQFAVLLIGVDLLKWLIHNLLHRVPFLWNFHKVHHSIVEMDWIGDWRFHWLEAIVYNSLLYVPVYILGVPGEIGLAVGIVDTIAGHFAHANLKWRIGWLTYIINTPQMHLWHHNHPDSGPINRNFGLTLSIWDWIFGTAYLPPRDPPRLGFTGVENYPRQLPGQWWAPFHALMANRKG